jgi:type I restriction enzyme R subunit
VEALRKEAENGSSDAQTAEQTFSKAHAALVEGATALFNNWELRNYIIDVRKKYDQYIDHVNPDEITGMGWVADSKAAAESLVQDLKRGSKHTKQRLRRCRCFMRSPTAGGRYLHGAERTGGNDKKEQTGAGAAAGMEGV